ncbi:hypothetical protein [Flavobacterium sp.]|uniref:hypothetical protein n=1 Tax=Flavobacterium sp. TaxID=239 RepID=UPI0038FC7E4A
MNQTKYYRADQLEFSFLQEMDSEYYSDRSNSLIDDSELGLYHQIFEDLRNEDIKNNSNLMKLNMENPWD